MAATATEVGVGGVGDQRRKGGQCAGLGSGRGSAAASAAVLLVGVATITNTYAARTATTEPALAVFFSPDARWAIHDPGDDTAEWVTSSVSAPGLEFASSLPAAMGNAVRDLAARHPDASVWTDVSTARYPSGLHINIPEVLIASAEGIEQPIGPCTLPLPLLYEPALRVLPAKLAPGHTWSQEGKASYAGIYITTYTTDNEIVRVDEADGCVEVRSHTILTATEQGEQFGATPYDESASTIYCPGRWSTKTNFERAGPFSASAEEALAAMADFDAPEANSGTDLPGGRAGLHPGQPERRQRRPAARAREPMSSSTPMPPRTSPPGSSPMVPCPSPYGVCPPEPPSVASPVLAGDLAILADSSAGPRGRGRDRLRAWGRPIRSLPRQMAIDASGRVVSVLDRRGRVLVRGARFGRAEPDVRPARLRHRTHGRDGRAHARGDRRARRCARHAPRRGHLDHDRLHHRRLRACRAGPGRERAGLCHRSRRSWCWAPMAPQLARRHLGFTSVDALAAGPGLIGFSAAGQVHLRSPRLEELATHEGGADSLRAGDLRGDVVLTATASDGSIPSFGADGSVRARHTAVVTSPSGVAVQQAGAVSHDGATYASVVTGVERFAESAR